jgi:hypothetical protein
MAASGTSWVLVTRNDFIALVTCLPTYRTMARYFKFLSQVYGFYLTHPRKIFAFKPEPLRNTVENAVSSKINLL